MKSVAKKFVLVLFFMSGVTIRYGLHLSNQWNGYTFDDPESIRDLQQGRKDALVAKGKKGSGISDPVDF